MLDQTHTIMLRGVAKGIVDGAPPAPALENLLRAGFVRVSDGEHVYEVTELGQQELDG